jgi:hypothetical protein
MISCRTIFLRAVLLLASVSAVGVGMAQAISAGAVNVATTPGSGDLTICRSWIVYESCTTYHKVALPERVAIGDDVKLIFGSNNKDYLFRVRRILHQGGSCKILSDMSDDKGEGERIDVPQCDIAEKPAAEAK